MKHCARFLAAAIVFCLATEAWAVNSVVVESKSVPLSSSNQVGVSLTNDVTLREITVPLVIREITPGVYPVALSGTYVTGARLDGYLNDIVILYEYDTEDGTCKSGSSGGFGTVGTVGPSNPDAIMFAKMSLFWSFLYPGTDGATPSIRIDFTTGSSDGFFEIDSTCTNPVSHLMFTNEMGQPVVPSFTPGVITVGNPVVNTPPVAVCVPLVTGTDAGTCERATVDPAAVDGGSFDADGDPITFRLNPLGPYPAGVNDVWLVVTDDPGDSDSCQTTITVEDQEPPTAICPSDVHLVVAYGATGDFVSFTIDADDNCPGVTVTSDPVSGSFFPIGITPVMVTATDASGNPNACYFNVIVASALPCNDRPVDVNCDGVVDVLDIVTVVNSAFRSVPEPGPCCGP